MPGSRLEVARFKKVQGLALAWLCLIHVSCIYRGFNKVMANFEPKVKDQESRPVQFFFKVQGARLHNVPLKFKNRGSWTQADLAMSYSRVQCSKRSRIATWPCLIQG